MFNQSPGEYQMKKLLFALLIGLVVFVAGDALAKRQASYRPVGTSVVQGYYKSNGTYVMPHTRSVKAKKIY